jgi:pimeloyl-ACP methyl ester carboxylesterase
MLFILLSTLLGMANASTSITLKTADGSTVHATQSAVSGSKKGVVFVHMLGRDSRDWDYLSKRLNGVKLSTIAIDLRGHGKSARAGTELTETDFQSMGHDLAAGVAWLRSKGVWEPVSEPTSAHSWVQPTPAL